MFKENLQEYTVKALEKRTVEVMTGEIVASVDADAGHPQVGRRAQGAHARLGRGPAGEPARPVARARAERGNRIGVGPDLTSRGIPRSTSSATSPRSRTRRPSRCCRSSARSRCSPASTPASRSPRRIAGKEPKPFKYTRQGDDGDDRPRRRGRADARRADDDGPQGAGRVGSRAPRAAADERGPREGGRRLGGAASRTSAPAGSRWRPSRRPWPVLASTVGRPGAGCSSRRPRSTTSSSSR